MRGDGPKTVRLAGSGAGEVQNRLPARIFTVDIRRRERRIQAVRFPNSVQPISSRCRLGKKETCEEKL